MAQSDWDLVNHVNRQINMGFVEVHVPGRMLANATDKERQAVRELIAVNKCTLIVDI
nr:hypothetical protein [Candidatus Sigynarchaeota archaeon]